MGGAEEEAESKFSSFFFCNFALSFPFESSCAVNIRLLVN